MKEFRTFKPENWRDIDQVFILPRPINGRYAKFQHSLEKSTSRSKCLNFKFFGCKLTRITDINSNKSSEMLPLEHELLSGDSTVLNTNLTRCVELCSIQNNCSVASYNISSNKYVYDQPLGSYGDYNETNNEHLETNRSIEPVGLCNHYMDSPFGLWKSKDITNGGHCFAKLQNIGIVVSFPRAKRKDGLYFGHVQYVDTDSIITSLSYPFRTILDSNLQWIVNFKQHQFAKLVFTNVSLSEVYIYYMKYGAFYDVESPYHLITSIKFSREDTKSK
ncbi:uncharacterized protein LOC132757554 [Ruditapes philippinarum]|uniref:uncharacterized protein LOC132757554 n=1 Tax=Ruditapes philippinarum TaxID=129788 RepID=UPI00295BD032|nr:uncharacterized protein LOC132757554 [Ruditapes philippinarum]